MNTSLIFFEGVAISSSQTRLNSGKDMRTECMTEFGFGNQTLEKCQMGKYFTTVKMDGFLSACLHDSRKHLKGFQI